MLLAAIDRTLYDIAIKEWVRELSESKVKISSLERYVHSSVGEWITDKGEKYSHYSSDIPLEKSFIY
jgi:hypothetical protein